MWSTSRSVNIRFVIIRLKQIIIYAITNRLRCDRIFILCFRRTTVFLSCRGKKEREKMSGSNTRSNNNEWKRGKKERYFYQQYTLFLNANEEKHESLDLIIHHNNKNILQVGDQTQDERNTSIDFTNRVLISTTHYRSSSISSVVIIHLFN
jgi:hypothetical protein